MTVSVSEVVDGKEYAVLCGAGVSATAGLPVAAALHDLIPEYVDHPSTAALLLLYPAQRAEAPRLRFEGILDVFQRLVDPELTVLEPYTRGFLPLSGSDHQPVGPTSMHVALASAARQAPVITTNVDSLIEAASLDAPGGHLPFPVASDEDAFKAATAPSPGLWKIHGTLCRVVGGALQRLPAGDPSGPVVTLQYISRTRESLARKLFVEAVLRQRVTVVVGYSGSDDFDLTLWLRDVASPRHLVWIQFINRRSQESIDSGSEEIPIEDVAAGKPGFADGLTRLARAWLSDSRKDRLTVIASTDPEGLLCEWQNQSRIKLRGRTPQVLARSPRNDWERSIVSGALLAQLCHFRPAIAAFERAHERAPGPFEHAAASLELARAWLELGGSRANFAEAGRWAASVLAFPNDTARIEGIHAHARIVEVTAKSRMNLAADVERELESLVATYKDSPSPDLQAAAFTAQAEIAVRRRWRGSDSPKPESELLASGPLPQKGTLAHGEALNLWKRAKTVRDLELAVSKLREAAEFRREMGEIGGLCASLNVLSLFAQRWAFMSRGEAVADGLGEFPGAPASASPSAGALAFAAERSQESLAFARRHAIPFHVGQALISLAVCRLRQGLPSDASAIITELSAMGDLDSRTDLESRFCVAMLLVGMGRLSAAAPLFTLVASDAQGMVERKFDERVAAIGEAAGLDAGLCVAWSKKSAFLPGRQIVLKYRKPALTADHARFAELSAAVPSSPLDHVARILDPLGP